MVELDIFVWTASEFGAASFGQLDSPKTSDLYPARLELSAASEPTHLLVSTDEAGCAVLAQPCHVDGKTFAAGTEIIPEHRIQIAGSQSATLIVGRFCATASHKLDMKFVFASTPLKAGSRFENLAILPAEEAFKAQNSFGRGTMIDTPHGAIPIEQLDDGDEIMTRDGGIQLISWVGSRRFSGLELALNPQMHPVRIKAGALTGGRPGQDLCVTQNHRMVVDDWRAPYLFGEDEILVPAKSLINDRTVFTEVPASGVQYFDLVVEGEGLACANGLWAETTVPDATALAAAHPDRASELHQVLFTGTESQNSNYTPAIAALPWDSTPAMIA